MSTRIFFSRCAIPLFFCLFSGSSSELFAADGTALISGRDFVGWKKPGAWLVAQSVKPSAANPKLFAIESGQGIIVNGTNGKTINLVSELEHGDCEAHVEFCVPKDSNSGIYFMGRYEVQVFDSFGKKVVKYSDCGGIYKSCSDPKPDSEGTPARVNASRAPGEWQTFDVVFRAPRFDAGGKKIENARFIKVVHNGVVIHENVESPRPTCSALALDEKSKGPLMLQGDHGPVAYRNLRLKQIKLD